MKPSVYVNNCKDYKLPLNILTMWSIWRHLDVLWGNNWDRAVSCVEKVIYKYLYVIIYFTNIYVNVGRECMTIYIYCEKVTPLSIFIIPHFDPFKSTLIKLYNMEGCFFILIFSKIWQVCFMLNLLSLVL